MIKKYNDFLNEKLTDKLHGFNADELKQQFLDGKIQIEQYIQKCIEYNLEKPSVDEIKTAISNFNPDDMLFAAVYYNYYDLVILAFERDAEIIKPSSTLLNAAYNDNIEIIKCLLKHNIKVTSEDIKCVKNKEIKEILQNYYDKQQI